MPTEPKEYKVIKAVIELLEYKIKSITNYIKNSEYLEAKRELQKAKQYRTIFYMLKSN